MINTGKNQGAKRAPRLAGADVKLDGFVDLAHDDDDDDDDDERLAGAMMEVVCIHPGVVRFHIDGSRHKMREGDIEKIPAAYATPVQFRPQGDPLPSVIERETNRKVLPVADPRVPKDRDGVPLAVKAKAERLAKAARAQMTAPNVTPGT